MAGNTPRSLLRPHGGSEARVSYTELFFDLVYVFAVTQLSHHLLGELTLLGAAQTLLLWFAGWLGWQCTCWVTNWFDPDALPVRAPLFALLLLALPMAAAIQVGRSIVVLWQLGGLHVLKPNFRRILGWNCIAAAFWLAGAAAQGGMRMALWAGAVACEYISPMFGFRLPGLGRSHTSDWTIHGGHLTERCQLFMIVALGESILVAGATIGGAKA